MSDLIEKWDCFELTLKSTVSGNPFPEVSLEVEFIHAHRSITVKGFYDGDDTYRVRFMPNMEGGWNYVTHSSLATLDGQTGEFLCIPPTSGNHGQVRVVDACHFAYQDGTPYHPVGTTCYVWNHQGDALEEQTLATLKSAPFNKMRMCVFPKHYAFNNNEPPCYPFERDGKGSWDFDRFNPEYFRRLEKRIRDLQALGIEADLIIFHPYDFRSVGFRSDARRSQRPLFAILGCALVGVPQPVVVVRQRV